VHTYDTAACVLPARVRPATALLEAMRAPDGGGGDCGVAVFERVAVVSDYASVRRFVTAWRTHDER
jgi:hypothetical protein